MLEQILNKYINKSCNKTFVKVGIVKSSSKYIKKLRNFNGKTVKQQEKIDAYIKQLPDKETLLKQITEKSFVEVGKIYNVTDNCIRR